MTSTVVRGLGKDLSIGIDIKDIYFQNVSSKSMIEPTEIAFENARDKEIKYHAQYKCISLCNLGSQYKIDIHI